MYAALLARRQAAAKLGGPNWEAKLDGGSDVMEVGAGGGGGGVDRNSVFQSARFQALVSCHFQDIHSHQIHTFVRVLKEVLGRKRQPLLQLNPSGGMMEEVGKETGKKQTFARLLYVGKLVTLNKLKCDFYQGYSASGQVQR